MSCVTQERTRILHRVKGRAALLARTKLLLIAVHRFARARAATPADRAWCARMIGGLEALAFDQPGNATVKTEEMSQ